MDIWLKINLTMLVVIVVCMLQGCKKGEKWNTFDKIGNVTIITSVWSWVVCFITLIWSN